MTTTPSDRTEKIARTLALVFHGDDIEWRGFLSKAEKFAAILVPDQVETALRDAFPHFQNDEPVTPKAIAGIGREWLQMVMDNGPSEIQFYDHDGNAHKIVNEPGDSDTGAVSDWVLSDESTLAVPDQGEAVAWRDGAEIPPVGVGTECEYIVAVYRKRTDKTYTFAASYLNGYRLNYEWGCPKNDTEHTCDGCEDGCPTTGWFVQTGEDGEGATFHTLDLKDGDEIKGWCELPAWNAAPPVQTPQVSDQLSEIIGHLGAAIIQSIDTDDHIIMGHIKAAHEIAKNVRRKA